MSEAEKILTALEFRAKLADQRRAAAKFNGMDFMAAEEVETGELLRAAASRIRALESEKAELVGALTGMCDAYCALLLMKAEDPSRFQDPQSPYGKAKGLLATLSRLTP